jgi:DNA-binding MarR family transcriptional regulator
MASNSELLDLYSSLRRNIALEGSAFLREVGFSLRQFLILRNVARMSEVPMTTIAEVCMTDAATVSRSVLQLCNEGYVKKSQCQNDGRVWNVELTEKGKSLIPELDRIHAKLADHCFASLSGAENDQLEILLKKVVGSLQNHRSGAAAENSKESLIGK